MAGRISALVLALALAASAGGATQRTRSWSRPVVVAAAEPDAGARLPTVALDARGNATALWEVSTTAGYLGATADRRIGHGWTRPAQLPGGVAGDLAVDPRGDALAVWTAAEGSSQRIRAAYRPAGGHWQAAVYVSSAAEQASVPHVAFDARGRTLAVWTVYGSTDAVEAASRATRGGWSVPKVLARSPSIEDVRAALDARGRALVVWSQACTSVPGAQCPAAGATSLIRAASRSAAGAWAKPVTVSSPMEDARNPQVALNARGTAVVAWLASVAAPMMLEDSVRPAGRSFGRPQTISEVVTGGPHLALAPTGEAVVVWSNGGVLYAAARLPGGQFGHDTTLATNGFAATVGVDARGDAIAVWTRSDGTSVFVHAARRPAGGRFGPGVDLGSVGADCWMHRCLLGGESAVAVAKDGSATAVWIVHPNPEQGFGGYVEAAEYS